MKRSSSPGVPLTLYESTNGGVIDNMSSHLLELVEARIWLLATHDVSALSAQELVVGGFCDPLKVFIKQEPHSAKKMKERRYRLVFSVSLVDQLVERFFANSQNEMEILCWAKIPSKPGIGFTNSAIEEFLANIPTEQPIVETDVSSWDWTVQAWELQAEAEMRIKLLVEPSNTLCTLIRSRYACMINKVCVFSDGDIELLENGVMPSGSYNTSASNSRIRVLASVLAGSVWAQAMGDDTIEGTLSPPDVVKQRYESLGHRIKDVRIVQKDDFEFCSHRFVDHTYYPSNPDKSLYRHIEGAMTLEQTAQFHDFICNHPDRDNMLEIVGKVQRERSQTTVSYEAGSLNNSLSEQ